LKKLIVEIIRERKERFTGISKTLRIAGAITRDIEK
jgi:hypothetical protein